jgi:hypothetical protein
MLTRSSACNALKAAPVPRPPHPMTPTRMVSSLAANARPLMATWAAASVPTVSADALTNSRRFMPSLGVLLDCSFMTFSSGAVTRRHSLIQC